MRARPIHLITAVIVLGAAACGSDDSGSADSSSPATEAPAATAAPAETAALDDSSAEAEGDIVDLAAVCPDPIVVQTDWYPSPEHGYLYSMIGDGGTTDTEKGTYRGPLLGSNVDLEIRSGGPYLGYQATAAVMYLDDSILLGYEVTDTAVLNNAELPTVAVMAPFIKNPQILMWDPEEYDFTTFDDIGESDATVLYFAGGAFVDYLVGIGAIREDQLDGGYDGSPARFIADDGIVQQGFATSEPYTYENVFEEFGRPVDYLVVADSGYDVYSQTLSAKPEAVEAEADCFAELIPMVQQAVVDFYADPAPTNQVILDIVEELDSSWVLDPGIMEYSAATTIEGGFVANGPDGVLGSMDPERMERMTELLIPLMNGPEDLQAPELYTNEFLDPTIALP